MSLYTSHFAHAQKLEPFKYVFVSIANSYPRDFQHPVVKLNMVVPPWRIVSDYKEGKISWGMYTEAYEAELTEEVLDAAMSEIDRIRTQYPERHIVFLCWENKGDCHRHIFSKKMNEKFNLDIKEL